MPLRVNPTLALVLAVIAVVELAAYRVGAVTSERPVVRQQFVKYLDPAAPDFVVGPADAGVPYDLFSGSGWAVFDVPSVTARSRVTARLNRIESQPWASYAELRGAREISTGYGHAVAGSLFIQPPQILARTGQVLVELSQGGPYVGSIIVSPGTYRLIVDTVSE